MASGRPHERLTIQFEALGCGLDTKRHFYVGPDIQRGSHVPRTFHLVRIYVRGGEITSLTVIKSRNYVGVVVARNTHSRSPIATYGMIARDVTFAQSLPFVSRFDALESGLQRPPDRSKLYLCRP
jgi:hypothetical protein